jgi:cation/acetate symporter
MRSGVNGTALALFALVVAATLGITWWAARRSRTATEFWAAGRSITGPQNGLAIAGDFMSAASFLGVGGLIFIFGFDGFIYATGFLVSFLTVLLLVAERLRNAGKFTMADVLSFRLDQRPARGAAALGTLTVAGFFLIAQMVGAGALLHALMGLSFELSVLITGAFMVVYVAFGGMLATTWVQIVKACLLLVAAVLLTVLVLVEVHFSPGELVHRAEGQSLFGDHYLRPGNFFANPLDAMSLGLALVLGAAGLPHVLMRFFTVPDAKAARSSVNWAVGLIGVFYVLVIVMGLGATAVLGKAGIEATGPGGNLALPLLGEQLGGGAGTFGGDLLFAFVAAVAFATILAVVAGVVMAASGAVAHDVWTAIVRRGRNSEREEVLAARLAALTIGIVAMAVAIVGGPGLNISFMIGLAVAVAASANFPALLLSLTWRRFTTAGAVTGMLVGVVSSVTLVIVSPKIWPGADSVTGSPIGWKLSNPGIVSIPLGFLGCVLGSLATRAGSGERSFAELRVRSETGLGAEVGEVGATGR